MPSKTRESIIKGMALTLRHDFGLDKGDGLSSGMTSRERESLLRDMQQLFDHNLEEIYRGYVRYEKLRRLNPKQFTDLWTDNLKGTTPFDDMVDKL